jgi:hypothetical protein
MTVSTPHVLIAGAGPVGMVIEIARNVHSLNPFVPIKKTDPSVGFF